MKTRFQKFDPKPLKQIRSEFEKSGKYNTKITQEKSRMKQSLSSLAKKSVSLGKKNLARNFDSYLEKSLM